MADEANQKAPDSTWSVSERSLLVKYRTELDDAKYKQLLAEAAVDELIGRNGALMHRLEEVTREKDEQRLDFEKKLEEIREELNALTASDQE